VLCSRPGCFDIHVSLIIAICAPSLKSAPLPCLFPCLGAACLVVVSSPGENGDYHDESEDAAKDTDDDGCSVYDGVVACTAT
jgi:hypothetical protein